ncbi:MAG TPA: DUF4912 domain-containing protein, partial [Chthoniobacterales bacterium]
APPAFGLQMTQVLFIAMRDSGSMIHKQQCATFCFARKRPRSYGRAHAGPMDFELNSKLADKRRRADGVAGFDIGATPVVATDATDDAGALRRSDGPPIFCLMARDPHTLFAYWDVDWTEAFSEGRPPDRKVHLRVTNPDGGTQEIEVEPLAGSCYVQVETADASYGGELGFYQPEATWNSIAHSEMISTPPEDLTGFGEDNFATVPFHLSFQKMVDMLRESRTDERPLVVQLTESRERARSGAAVPAQELDLNKTVHELEATTVTPAANAPEIWRRERLERILGFGATSPAEGFRGGS